MEALGFMAAGIAHDFNNLLTALWGRLDAAHAALEPASPAARELEQAMTAYDRARRLAGQLLAFARGGSERTTDVALAPLLAEVTELHLTAPRLTARVTAPPDLWRCHGDPDQLHQLLSNILVNARQAMPEGGTITLEAANTQVGAPNALGLNPGAYVRLAVTDEGPGIPATMLDRIFDPFVSGRKGGTGLGLAIAHAIVAKHRGAIVAESPVSGGGGTRFVVHLPAVPAAPGVDAAAPRGAPATAPPGRVLVLDDEPLALRATGSVLRSLGHDVQAVATADDALAAAREAQRTGRPFTVAILDLTIRGGVGGAELAPALRRASPGTALVAYSGYSDDDVLRSPAAHGFDAALAKPFRRADLANAIAEALNVAHGRSPPPRS